MRKTENIINRTGINKTECKKNGHSKENKIPGVKCTPKIELYLSNFKGALHWWNGSLFFLIIILGITLGIFAGCKNIFVPEPPATPEAAGPGGGITVSLRLFTGSARTVMPEMDLLTWHITAKQGTDNIEATGTYPTYTLELPTTGPWTFTVKGTKDDKELFTGTVTENVSNSTTSISIPLSPGDGMGGDEAKEKLNLTIKPENVCVMLLSYRIDNGAWSHLSLRSEAFMGGGGTIYYPYEISEELSVGQHTLDLYFDGGSGFYFCTVAVNIWPGMTSDQWIKTSGEEYINDIGDFVITEEMVNEFVKTMGSVVFVNESVGENTPGTGSIYAPVNSVSKAVEILRKANPGGKCNGTIMVSEKTTIDREIVVKDGESLTVKGMGADASIKNDKGRVFKITGGSLTLGENIILTGTVTDGNGGAVYVNGGTFTMKADSKITESSAIYGGGVYVDSEGTFTMGGGTISKNSASYVDESGNGASGGGVCISDGTFTMSGTATLQGNTATRHGGGVYIFSDGTFTMEDGSKITGGEAAFGGGVYVADGSFTMKDTATIQYNRAANHGGGVHILSGGIFTMNGGTIGGTIGGTVGNTAEFGGGVFVSGGTFNMNDGTISGNTVTESGGGVHVNNGNFTMNGGTIGGPEAGSTNTAQYGGGVYVVDGTFTMTGGIISGNTATNGNGGGVYVSSISSTGSFTLDSSSAGSFPVISGNTKKSTSPNNVYLYDGKTLSITGKLQKTVDTGNIGISMANPGVFTSNWSSSGLLDSTFFFSDDGSYKIELDSGECKLVTNDSEVEYEVSGSIRSGTFAEALAAVNAAGGTITLLKNIDDNNAVFGASSANNQPITFKGSSESISFILDLNGKTIDRGLGVARSDGSVIKIVGGTLTIKDSSAAPDGTNGTGTITGGNSSNTGGGIHITNNSMGSVPGSLILESGKIWQNNADRSNGGGVYIDRGCALTMKGGSIDGNTVKNSATSYGGGVFVYGTFTMENGIITKNSSEQGNGGGVNIGSNGTFTMTGGTISDNDAGTTGGGVYIGSNGVFTMSDGTISANNAGMTGGGVNLGTSGATMTLKGGTISGNTATSGNGGGVGVSTGNFTMNGGTLSGNTATSGNGGGVYVDGSTSNFTMTGGTIGGTKPNTAGLGGGVYVGTGNFTLGPSSAESSPVVSGNTKTGSSPNNVYLDTGKTLSITGKLKKTEGAGNIGISMATLQEFTSGWSTFGSTDSTFFFSDNPQYKIAVKMVNGQNELQLINE